MRKKDECYNKVSNYSNGSGDMKKEMIAMLLAGGQGSRLGVLTSQVAKPAVSFGGKYRIIDFALSNCINSGVDTVGVLTQYQPLQLNSHIGIGIPWDLDRNDGGVTILPPYEQKNDTRWYGGTANAIYQNIRFIEEYDPDYVLILSGDHIYKMDYDLMLEYHKSKKAAATLAVMPVAQEEAHRFGIMVTDSDRFITEFQEKPDVPKSNLASMGIYIFSWPELKEALLEQREKKDLDFGKDVIPYLMRKGQKLAAYECNGYWKDVGTLYSYWEANMGLIDLIPEFNLYEEYWKIYTRQDLNAPLYVAPEGHLERCLTSYGCEISGSVRDSVLGANILVEEGAQIRDSILMAGCRIGRGARINKAILAENCVIGEGAVLGAGEEAPNQLDASIYTNGLVTVGENSIIPAGVVIGRNTAIYGETTASDYPGGTLPSGGVIIKAGEEV